MIDQLQHLGGEPPEATSYTDFYELEAAGDTYIVALSTAVGIEHRVDRCATADELEFDDVFGARHRLPARCVYRISESMSVTRARLRELKQARSSKAAAASSGEPHAS